MTHKHHQEASEHHAQVYAEDAKPHESTWTHELLGGAAAFEAMKLYEDKKNPGDSHALAKEILAGIAGTQIDKLFETKGLDFLDKEKAKHEAKQKAYAIYDEQHPGAI
ncbi:hypothetical protein BGX21_011241 [Mortierella sp. AD011]|nr:hypothetical protein BGX20_011277 [Mortierella sp. AD010]KAF9391477.1 hypothetical protein BGX21_011241 [Mortierella sp. AD011]